jgi:exosortase/archaeosortase family protein
MKQKKEMILILSRYLILLFLGIFSSIIYFVFFYITIWPSYFLLGLFYPVSLSGGVLEVSGMSIGIVSACVAGSAYYLLLILNLTTRMKKKQRICSLLFSLGALLAVNVARIVLFSVLLVENYFYFELLHMFFWYVMSLLIVVAIWFLTAYLFKIKGFPVYSDLKNISNMKKSRKK